jgi:outer membrane protein OmpA-like peptidoglycan-associated protein
VNSETIFLKGLLSCQYSIADQTPVGKTPVFPNQGRIRLEPRFRLYESEEVSEEEFRQYSSGGRSGFISQLGKHDVEVYFKASGGENIVAVCLTADELFLMPEHHGNVQHGKDQIQTLNFGDILSKHPELQTYNQPFIAHKGKDVYGRIAAPAYVRLTKPTIPPHVENRKKGLDTGQVVGTSNLPSGCNFFASMIKGGQRSSFLTLPTSMTGCGLPLGLLLVAGLLFWLLKCNNGPDTSIPPPVIIHDTVFVEVEKKDTLLVVRTDTIRMIDSTLITQYETINLPNVQFVTNSDVLLPSSATDLQQLADLLVKNDSLSATIYGHTDSIGKRSENIVLSQRRAESVKKFLQSLGVDGDRLKAVGMGPDKPKADNRTEEGRLINRRVEVELEKRAVATTKRTIVDDPNPEAKNGKED